jgi:hypothetical protein
LGGARQLADLDLPNLRSALDICPGELFRVLGLKLIVERFRIVIVDEHETSAGRQLVDELEYLRMALCRYEAAHVDDIGGCLGGVAHVETPWSTELNRPGRGGDAFHPQSRIRAIGFRRCCLMLALRRAMAGRLTFSPKTYIVNVSF